MAPRPPKRASPEVFRSAIVAADALDDTVNAWAADGFFADLEWTYLDGEQPAFGKAPAPWLHVWAWLAEPDEGEG